MSFALPNKALFLDRDGVINADSGYVSSIEQIRFIDGIFDFCRHARGLGYRLIVVTNQSGIGRGYYTEAEFHQVMQWMQRRFEDEQCAWEAYYFCPHHPVDAVGEYLRNCRCRKPKPGMIEEAIATYHIDAAQSLLIGDSPRDIEAGKAAGVGRLHLFNGVEWPHV